MFGIQMFMRIQKWNLEVELNSAKLKKVKTWLTLLKFKIWFWNKDNKKEINMYEAIYIRSNQLV